MKITVIPLDSRPCNYSWVKKYTNLAKVELAIYPFEYVGNLHRGMKKDNLKDWLISNSKDSDVLLVSLDAITSGGLIQARQAKFELEEAYYYIDLLKEIKNLFPKIKIYVFDTIMRTSITTYDEETAKYWKYINEYSNLKGRMYFFPEENNQDRLNNLIELIPEHIFRTYESARTKKNTLNKYIINLTKNGFVDYLLLLQEDSMQYGIQQIESIQLQELIHEYKLEDKVSLYNGTDEGTVVLIAKILLEYKNKKPSVCFIFPKEELKNKVMPFEDKPVYENCKYLANVIGIKEVPQDEADYIFAVYTEDKPYNLDVNTTRHIPLSNEVVYQEFILKINEYILNQRKVLFVDLLHPNGGSVDLLQKIDYKKLVAYSAWNTASNSIGSCIALIGVCEYHKQVELKTFLFERIIDDCLYQTEIRREVNQLLLKDEINIYDLKEHSNSVLQIIDDKLSEETKRYFNFDFKLSLPWNRTFEIDIDID